MCCGRMKSLRGVATGGLSKGVCYIYREWNAQEQKLVKGQGPAQGCFWWHVSGALKYTTCSGRRHNLSAAGQSLSQHLLSASSLCTSLNYLLTIIWRWSYISIAHHISHVRCHSSPLPAVGMAGLIYQRATVSGRYWWMWPKKCDILWSLIQPEKQDSDFRNFFIQKCNSGIMEMIKFNCI